MLRVQICICSLSYFGEWLYSKCKTCLAGEKRSAHQLLLKAVVMLRSSTQLVKSHRDDLSLEFLWNRDEYSSLENSLKAMEKNAEYGGQQEILAQSLFTMRLRQRYCIWRSFTDCPSIDIPYQSRRT